MQVKDVFCTHRKAASGSRMAKAILDDESLAVASPDESPPIIDGGVGKRLMDRQSSRQKYRRTKRESSSLDIRHFLGVVDSKDDEKLFIFGRL